MPDVFHANQVTIACIRSQDPNDPGEILLVFECLCPGLDQTLEVTGKVVIGMTHANGASFAKSFHAQLEAPQGIYRGPVIRKQ